MKFPTTIANWVADAETSYGESLDSWFPGWEVTVDGRPARLRRADYAFRAVEVGAGKSIVRFDYRPAPLRLGLMLALAAVLLLSLAYVRLAQTK